MWSKLFQLKTYHTILALRPYDKEVKSYSKAIAVESHCNDAQPNRARSHRLQDRSILVQMVFENSQRAQNTKLINSRSFTLTFRPPRFGSFVMTRARVMKSSPLFALEKFSCSSLSLSLALSLCRSEGLRLSAVGDFFNLFFCPLLNLS